jgi:hypothetical protein
VRFCAGTLLACDREVKNEQKLIPVSSIQGLVSLEVGPPMDMARTKGFDFGVVLCLEGPEYLDVFAKHPAHIR